MKDKLESAGVGAIWFAILMGVMAFWAGVMLWAFG